MGFHQQKPAPLCMFMKTVRKTDVYLPLLRVTGIFNMTKTSKNKNFLKTNVAIGMYEKYLIVGLRFYIVYSGLMAWETKTTLILIISVTLK